MVQLEFNFDNHFQEMIECLGFAKSIVLKFIHDKTNRGNEFKKLSAEYIHEYVFCISKSLISKTLRDLEKDKLIESKKNEIDKFDRVKFYNISEESLKYFNIEKFFNYEHFGVNKFIIDRVYYDFNDYKKDVKYKGLTEIEYINYLLIHETF